MRTGKARGMRRDGYLRWGWRDYDFKSTSGEQGERKGGRTGVTLWQHTWEDLVWDLSRSRCDLVTCVCVCVMRRLQVLQWKLRWCLSLCSTESPSKHSDTNPQLKTCVGICRSTFNYRSESATKLDWSDFYMKRWSVSFSLFPPKSKDELWPQARGWKWSSVGCSSSTCLRQTRHAALCHAKRTLERLCGRKHVQTLKGTVCLWMRWDENGRLSDA